jgi:predicted metalloprotease with PDZ domain
MMMSRGSFSTDRGYDKSARMVAHEFFHLWNVKRIRDVVLGPFDYTRENHTDLLWFHEGFTETAEAIALLHAGLWTPAEFLRAYAKRLTDLRQRPGRNFAPVAQMSHQAWTKGYKPEPNHRNVAVSYYDKGDLLGVALDLEIRKRSGKGSLIGVFRRLMKSHGRKGKGITHADIVAAASAEAGADLGGFFDRYVRGVEELPLPALVDDFGVAVEAKASSDPWIGAQLRGHAIKSVDPGSPADAAGLMRDDEIIAVDGHRTDDEQAVAHRLQVGKTATLHVFRDGRLVDATVTAQKNPFTTYHFTLDKNADPAELELRKAWLGR